MNSSGMVKMVTALRLWNRDQLLLSLSAGEFHENNCKLQN